MKTIKWFRTGDPIPDNAVYLKTEAKIVDYIEEHPQLDATPVYQDFHLYEVPLAPETPNGVRSGVHSEQGGNDL